MNTRNRLILVNAGIVAGLLLMFYRRTPMVPLLITGAFLLVFANVLMAVKK